MSKSWRVWTVFAVYLAVRIWVYVASDNGIDHHHNAFDRPLFVEQWLQEGRVVPDPAYPPVHFYLLALLRVFSAEMVHAPRLLSLFCALLTFWPLFSLTRRLFGEAAGWWTGLAFAFFPLAARTAVISLEVAPYLLFVALACERLSKGWEGKRDDRRALLWGAFWLTVACATRFEGWLLLPPVVAIALWRNRRSGLPVGAIGCLFPIVWLIFQWRMKGDPFHFLQVSGGISRHHMAALSLPARLLGWPRILFFSMGPLAALAAAEGLIQALRRRRGGWLALLFGVSLPVFMLRTALGTFGLNETKYAAALGLLLLPFAGLSLATLIERLGPRRRLTVVVLFSAIGAAAIYQIHMENRAFLARPDLRATAAWLAAERDGRPVVIGTRDQGYLLIHGRIPPASRLPAQTRDETGDIDRDHFRTLLQQDGEKLLVYDRLRDGLDFHPLLQLSGAREQQRQGCYFTRIFQAGDYEIYLVTPE